MESEKGKKIIASATNESVTDDGPGRKASLMESEKGKKIIAAATNESVADDGPGRKAPLMESEKGKKIIASATNESVADDGPGRKASLMESEKGKKIIASATNDSVTDDGSGRKASLMESEKGKKIIASATNESVADDRPGRKASLMESEKGKKIIASATNESVTDDGQGRKAPLMESEKGKKIIASATNESVADDGPGRKAPLMESEKGMKIIASATNDSVTDDGPGRKASLMESEKGKKIISSATNESVADDGPGRKAPLMESEKGKKIIASATNESVTDNDCDEPWNRLMEKHLRSLARTLHTKELVDHLVNLAITFPQAAEEIKSAARAELADRRLIVYGLRKETTSRTLCKAFSSFGEIAEGNVVADTATGKSLRYGFITFKHMSSVEKALEKTSIWIDGSRAFYIVCHEGFEGATATADSELRRLYVSEISTDVTNEMFLSFFAKYGEIEEGSIIYDDETRKSRGFGFVTFKTFEEAMSAVNEPDKMLGNNRVFVRHAFRFKHRNR